MVDLATIDHRPAFVEQLEQFLLAAPERVGAQPDPEQVSHQCDDHCPPPLELVLVRQEGHRGRHDDQQEDRDLNPPREPGVAARLRREIARIP